MSKQLKKSASCLLLLRRFSEDSHMKIRTKDKQVLMSFVGTNDQGGADGSDGAILTVFKALSFDEVHLLWNSGNNQKSDFRQIAERVQSEIIKRGHTQKVSLHEFPLDNVTDHNEIYPKLLNFCKGLESQKGKTFVAAIASGTPAMQVCWILMAESGDFPLELIRSNEPKYGSPLITPVKLGTGLPRIVRLQKENKRLKKQTLALIPNLVIDVKAGIVEIGGSEIPLAPIEFCYYRYFAHRAKAKKDFERFSEITIFGDFPESIAEYFRETFPDANDATVQQAVKKGLERTTFRGNVSKANKKIHSAITNEESRRLFEIGIDGKRFAKRYGIRTPAEKVAIK